MADRKSRMMARLALARARAWETLLALPERVLCEQPITGDWTTKDILAHLAFWDSTRAEQLALLLDGRAAEMATPASEDINPRVYAERRAWPLCRAVSELQASRARFLAVVEPIGDQDLDRVVDVPPLSRMTVAAFIERRAAHEGGHLEPVTAWREAARPGREAGPKCVLEAALTDSRAALLAWGRELPPDEWTTRPVTGTWTWQQTLGHVADWELYIVRGLQDLAAGRTAGSDYDPDEDAWNRRHVDARRGEDPDKTWHDFQAARRDLLGLLAGLDDAALAQPAATPIDWLQTVYLWFYDCVLHDVAHAEAVVPALEAG